MSYGLKYRLSFDSVSDTPYEINILEAGYDGPVENRNLGSAPPDFVNVSPKNHLQIMGRYVDVVS